MVNLTARGAINKDWTKLKWIFKKKRNPVSPFWFHFIFLCSSFLLFNGYFSLGGSQNIFLFGIHKKKKIIIKNAPNLTSFISACDSMCVSSFVVFWHIVIHQVIHFHNLYECFSFRFDVEQKKRSLAYLAKKNGLKKQVKNRGMEAGTKRRHSMCAIKCVCVSKFWCELKNVQFHQNDTIIHPIHHYFARNKWMHHFCLKLDQHI